MEEALLLRLVMLVTAADQILHPIAVIAARQHLHAVVHDLVLRSVGLAEDLLRQRHLGDIICTAAAFGDADALL